MGSARSRNRVFSGHSCLGPAWKEENVVGYGARKHADCLLVVFDALPNVHGSISSDRGIDWRYFCDFKVFDEVEVGSTCRADQFGNCDWTDNWDHDAPIVSYTQFTGQTSVVKNAI